MQVKVYRVACVPAIRNAFLKNWRQWRHCFWRLTSRPLFFLFHSLRPTAPPLWSLSVLFQDGDYRDWDESKKGWGGGERCAWFIRRQTQWGSNQHYIGCQHQVGVRHFTSRAAAVSSKTSRHSGCCLHCKAQSATLWFCYNTTTLHWKITELTIIAILFQQSVITTWQCMCSSLKRGCHTNRY